MKITINQENTQVKEKFFGDVLVGDMFFDLDRPDEPYIKTWESHGEADGAGFNLCDRYEDEFDDNDQVGVYIEQEVIVKI